MKFAVAIVFGFVLTMCAVQKSETGHIVPRFKPSEGVRDKVEGTNLYRAGGLYIAMVAGVVCGSVYEGLRANKPQSRKGTRRVVIESITCAPLLRGLLASPIVFAAIYAMTREHPDALLAAALAFENGFFCDVVLKKRGDEGSRRLE